MQKISQNLLSWYDKNHRILPWRMNPEELSQGKKPDPYHVWLSEIMLQQTTVEAVKPYFEKFIKKWPTVLALSNASQDDILKQWAGLGYYSRARNLKKCADDVVNRFDGVFPSSKIDLQTLAGIGDYTAAAIAAIAFNRCEAVVDGNVERVITRLFTIETELKKAKKDIKKHTVTLTPKHRPGDFAQAMMDLGAKVCAPRQPHCPLCPLNMDCRANAQGNAHLFPIKEKKKTKPIRKGFAFVALNKDQHVYLERRHDKGLLAGMTQVPNQFSENEEVFQKCRPFAANWQLCGQAKHIFTHFILILEVYLAKNIDKTLVGNGWWCPLDKLEREALPTAMKKVLNTALKIEFKKNHE
ncbi:A/G-specific adenine glycosylase [Bartonella tamiae]|uniref:Adenine DNA glycosylase n=1 Tax=Bartonella tamiae Th239 TaxID=1094558 RepID=J1K0J7_9HYPH|nr:A/G-specific adenine glycosylase [Bartonella tamiae]EJF90545.1 A/G-specific adenine glycosylase [Bartonella tamiae Th239]EJF94077.1 A/G-specific adenine glycosylase [Bartonella tamiae Th307]